MICDERSLLLHQTDWLLAEGEISDTALQSGAVTETISQAQQVSHHWLAGRKALCEGPAVVQLDLDVAVVGGEGEVVPGLTDLSMVVESVLVLDHQEAVLEEDGQPAGQEDQARPAVGRPEAQPEPGSGCPGEEGGGE